jgi:hypothetical protein
VIRALVAAAVLLLPAGGALAASFTLDDRAQQAAIRVGERSTTTETFDREWRVSSNGESVTVLTPFHRLVVAARHAAFKNQTIRPDEVSRVLKKDPGRLVVAVQLRGKREDFARRYRPMLVAGSREIKPSFVQNEHTAVRQEDGVYVARCLYTFPSRELTEKERLVLRVADEEGRELNRFTIDLASMR